MTRTLRFSLVGLSLALALPAAAQVQLQQMSDEAAGPEPLPVGAWISLSQSVGSGTVGVGYRNPSTATTLTLTPMLNYRGWQILVNQNFGLEWTQSDSTTYANQLELSDTSIVVRNMRLLRVEAAGLSFWPSLGYVVPISMASRQIGSLGTPTASVRANWGGLSDYGFTFFGGLNGGWTLSHPSLSQRFAGQDVRPVSGARVNPTSCNVRNAQELQNYGCGPLPNGARWGASVGMWWFYLLDGNLGASASLGYNQSFTLYTLPDDEYTADNAVPGVVPNQSTSADISVTYMPTPWLWLGFGWGSGQPLWNADQSAPRFPFWDFVSPNNNFSAFHLDATFVL